MENVHPCANICMMPVREVVSLRGVGLEISHCTNRITNINGTHL